jgi:hypothetical protein
MRMLLAAALVATVIGGCGHKTTVFPTCGDNLVNGEETDVDCGGRICSSCNSGKHCLVDRDCRSKLCNSDLVCSAPSCNDGVLNGSESDIDCGGPDCAPCADGRICAGDNDCRSCVCTGGTCQTVSDPSGFCDAGVHSVPDLINQSID